MFYDLDDWAHSGRVKKKKKKKSLLLFFLSLELRRIQDLGFLVNWKKF